MTLRAIRNCAAIAVCGLLVIAAHAQQQVAAIQISGERRVNFDGNWRFYKGDAPGAENPGFNDSQWKLLRLPHDWAIEGPFDEKNNPSTGGLPVSGTGWYRKSFLLPESAKDRIFTIMFDGAMSNSTVWLNGEELGGRPYGYSSFYFNLTPHLRFGAEANVIAVRLQPEPNASRWYPGAGIYRNVWLDITAPVHVAEWGTYVTTPEVSDAKATVSVKADVKNENEHDAQVIIRNSVIDASGKVIAKAAGDKTGISGQATRTVSASLTVPNPHRWDMGDPYLYELVTEVLDGDRVVDKYTTSFGIRTIAFDRDKGFLLNGKARKLNGVCLHHDLGALGAAVNRRAIERQIEILKAAGVNAIRTSHNPPAPELLDLSDRMGIVVMDEAFDMWRIPKVPNGYSKYFDEWSERDLRDLARRDRNHPSIIMWSIGNEIPEQNSPDGWKIGKQLTQYFHEEDPTRPTTSAMNQWEAAIRNHFADEVDVKGFNYAPTHYEQIRNDHPDWVVYGSETESCVSSRGEYHLPLLAYEKPPSHQVNSYDTVAPVWAYCPDVEFTYQTKLPMVPGEFVWTGFDYIGEPTPYWEWRSTHEGDWPARSSYFGFVDLAGFRKDRYYLYQSEWTTKPMVHLVPQNWNLQGHEGETWPVFAYSNADEVELFLNGKSLGRKKRFSEPFEIPVNKRVSDDGKFVTKFRLRWEVAYQPGTLKAVAYSGGKQVAVQEVRTAGAPARIKLTADRNLISADGDDLSYITVRIEDKSGNLVPTADNLVHFDVSGAGDIAGVDNGNAATTEPFHADHRKAFNGLALLIVRSRNDAGKIHIVASGDGLTSAQLDIRTQTS
ncbi:MAG TPA: beta-galactosidase GalB, partial [Terriglobales bacterium]|nr:beta-galactosidase GalB [Terriglobales bacterium]